MLANPQFMVNSGFVKNLTDIKKQIQPNAIDFTVDQIQMMYTQHCMIGEGHKEMRMQRPLDPEDGWWKLSPSMQYDVSSNVYVEVPEGYAALLILRSTFVRNGMWLASGLYDSGFKGNIGAVLHTGSTYPTIEVGVRIGQIMFIESKSAGVYAGGYNTTDGTHWNDKK